MPSPAKLVLGMMSGTSADGIDAALVEISGAPPHLKIRLINHTQQSFAPEIRKEILRVAEQNPLTPGELSQLHARLGHVYASAALAACRTFQISPQKIDFIGNHGQTIFHQGRSSRFLGKPIASTLQLGEGSTIASLTGITTISDFRPADMALGGQGAPLVPFADYALYRHPRLGRVSLNIGGIANVTVIPASAKPSEVRAFDTGPGNMLIDALVQDFTRGRQRYDQDARIARTGHLHRELLAQLLREPYFQRKPPKSTGREYFGAAYVKEILARARRYKLKPQDLIHTVTVLTARSIAAALRRFVLPRRSISQLIVSGGGAQNPLLMSELAALLPDLVLLPSARFNVPTDAKEALAFAVLAYETFHRRPSNLPTATGARGPAILGKISYAPSG
jgi:anhydro-N-acetylmuramic acid kinase